MFKFQPTKDNNLFVSAISQQDLNRYNATADYKVILLDLVNHFESLGLPTLMIQSKKTVFKDEMDNDLLLIVVSDNSLIQYLKDTLLVEITDFYIENKHELFKHIDGVPSLLDLMLSVFLDKSLDSLDTIDDVKNTGVKALSFGDSSVSQDSNWRVQSHAQKNIDAILNPDYLIRMLGQVSCNVTDKGQIILKDLGYLTKTLSNMLCSTGIPDNIVHSINFSLATNNVGYNYKLSKCPDRVNIYDISDTSQHNVFEGEFIDTVSVSSGNDSKIKLSTFEVLASSISDSLTKLKDIGFTKKKAYSCIVSPNNTDKYYIVSDLFTHFINSMYDYCSDRFGYRNVDYLCMLDIDSLYNLYCNVKIINSGHEREVSLDDLDLDMWNIAFKATDTGDESFYSPYIGCISNNEDMLNTDIFEDSIMDKLILPLCMIFSTKSRMVHDEQDLDDRLDLWIQDDIADILFDILYNYTVKLATIANVLYYSEMRLLLVSDIIKEGYYNEYFPDGIIKALGSFDNQHKWGMTSDEVACLLNKSHMSRMFDTLLSDIYSNRSTVFFYNFNGTHVCLDGCELEQYIIENEPTNYLSVIDNFVQSNIITNVISLFRYYPCISDKVYRLDLTRECETRYGICIYNNAEATLYGTLSLTDMKNYIYIPDSECAEVLKILFRDLYTFIEGNEDSLEKQNLFNYVTDIRGLFNLICLNCDISGANVNYSGTNIKQFMQELHRIINTNIGSLF